jgi:hypothetical protein
MVLLGLNRQFGDTASDLTSLVTQIPGVTDAADYIQGKVKDVVAPYVIASLMLGLAGFTFGLAAFIGMKSMKKARAA